MSKYYVNIITDFGRSSTYLTEEELDKLKELCYNNDYYYIIIRTNGGEN